MSRKPQFDPMALWMLGFEYSRMMMEAQSVIAMRLMGMSGFWGMSRGEETRMVTEKQKAFMDSGLAMWKAALGSKAPEAVLRAGIKPLGRATSGNVRRLSRKGPRLPRT